MHIPLEGLLTSEMTAQVEESSWLAAAQHGNPEALEWMFREYHRLVFALCYRLLERRDDAEDATQAAFVSAFRSIRAFRADSSLKTWLYRIAVNESRNLLRRRRRDPLPLCDDCCDPRGGNDAVEKVAVAAALKRMHPDQRLPLVLFYWEDLSCEEIAEVMGVSLSAAKMRLMRARAEFQKVYGGEP